MGHSPTPNDVQTSPAHEEPTKFDILRFKDIEELVAAVNTKLHEGWSLHSKVHVLFDQKAHEYNYWQAITR